MQKYNKDIKKPDINGILRRVDLDADGRISFKEFSVGITPEYPGLEPERMEFHVDKKEELKQQIEENKKTDIKDRSPSPLRDYRNIYMQEQESPVRQEFKNLKLREQKDPDKEFLIDLQKIGSPSKKKSPGKGQKGSVINENLHTYEDESHLS